MSFLSYVLTVVIVVVLVGYLLDTFYLPLLPENKKSKGEDRATQIWISLLIIMLFTPLWYEYPGFNTPVTFKPDGSVVKHSWGMFHWPWGGNFARIPNTAAPIQGRVMVMKNDSTITKTTYTLEFEVTYADKLFSEPEQRDVSPHLRTYWLNWEQNKPMKLGQLPKFKDSNAVDILAYKIIGQEMHDLNKRYARRLTQYKNPTKESTQKAFGNFVEERLNPKLSSEGLRVEFKHFTRK